MPGLENKLGFKKAPLENFNEITASKITHNWLIISDRKNNNKTSLQFTLIFDLKYIKR